MIPSSVLELGPFVTTGGLFPFFCRFICFDGQSRPGLKTSQALECLPEQEGWCLANDMITVMILRPLLFICHRLGEDVELNYNFIFFFFC